MGDDSYWKRRLPCRIYNYNYKVAEGYYKPQSEYMQDKQYESRSKSPPKHQSYAERFSKYPWYGCTTGLPYPDKQSAGPLIKLGDRQWRTSSLLREMKDLEAEGVPLALRASRRKKRFEEEEELAGLRKRASRNYSMEEKKEIPRNRDFHFQVEQKIKSLDQKLKKSTQTVSDFAPPKWNYQLDHPSRQVKHSDDYYSPINTKPWVSKTSHAESSLTSSKPPIIPLRVRHRSTGNDDFSPKSRIRFNSGSGGDDFSQLPRTSRCSSEDEEELPLYSNRAPRLREVRRHQEAQEFQDDICKKVDMMRMKNVEVDPLVVYSHNRNPRLSSLDRIPRRRSCNTSRYVYGIGKI